jgi:hypothetical protein
LIEPSVISTIKVKKYPTKKISNPTKQARVDCVKKAEMNMAKVMIDRNVNIQKMNR